MIERTQHGHARARDGRPSSEYVSWVAMRQRCSNTHDRRYVHYGGRGITVCEAWRASFAAFIADMGPKPTTKHTLDRIDNDGNYEPGNCRWATPLEQMRNRPDVVQITIGEETAPLVVWAERTGVKAARIHGRITRGWNPAAAVTTPFLPQGKATKGWR